MTSLAHPETMARWPHAAASKTATATFATELRSWAFAGAASLAIAGVFALLLALSRVPGIERIVAWPIGFFSKGLVIHVIFSLVIWFLVMFALLVSLATRELAGDQPRLKGFGRAGLALVSMSFPMLFVPAFYSTTTATLNNYVPVIIHPMYYLGLAVLAAGILLPVLRLFANVGRQINKLDTLPFAMTIAGVVYCVALITFARGLLGVWGEEPSRTMHETLFWGGGHVLQFLYAILMLTGWTLLARQTLDRNIVDPDIFRLAIGLIGVFSLAAIIFSAVMHPTAPMYTEVFRRLQFVLAFPSLLIGLGGLVAVLRARKAGPLPWNDAGFVALALSPLVFGAGGIMGLLITGSDTRTPAHYHGVIGGVQVACMGLMLAYCLPRLAGNAMAPARLKLQLALFAFGQLFASIGLFMAGGYGAPRKTPSGAVNLADGAAIGMFLHGIGALFAVLGGALFVWTVFRSLLNSPEAAREPPPLSER